MVREVGMGMGRHIPIMGDFPSIKIRLGDIDGVVTLKTGQDFTLTQKDIIGDEYQAQISFDGLPVCVRRGSVIFISDGQVELRVKSVYKKTDIICEVITGGNICTGKGVNVPGVDLKNNAFTHYDRECLVFCKKMGVEIICQSFIGSPKDVADVRRAGKQIYYHPVVIAKIETLGAVKSIKEIVELADGIMLGRGDLGVEVRIEKIGLIQKHVIREAVKANKTAIVATQLLSSMCGSRRPLRSEVADITNVVFDGTGDVMLADETAVGDYPVECVKMISKIMSYAQASEFILDEL